MVNNVPHVDYVEFSIRSIIQAGNILGKEFTSVALLEFFDAYLGDVYPADICSSLEIPFNEETCATTDVENLLTFEGNIAER
jgi:hypothetical protein